MDQPHWLSHWGLERSPMTMAAGVGQPYPSQAFEEATARIDYLIAERRRVGALIGESGEGKSTVLHAVAGDLRRRGGHVALVDANALSPLELLWQAASQWGAEPDPADNAARLWRRIEDTLAHHRWQGASTVLLVDDADHAGPDLQRQLVRLAGLESAPDSQWTLLLASTPKRLGVIDGALLERIDLRVDLFPWSEEDTVGCVQHALIDAGCFQPVFTDEALSRLHQLASGLPRHILRLADFALVAGAGAGAEEVGPKLIDAAFDELRWSPPVDAHLV